MKILLITIAISSLLLSCKETIVETGQSRFDKQFHNDSLIFSLKDRILIDADTTSYLELRHIYMLSDHYEEVLSYAYYIAYKKDLATAYFDIFACLPKNKEYLRIQGNYYLLLAYERGYYEAKDIVKDEFTDSLNIPTSQDYLKENRFCETIILGK